MRPCSEPVGTRSGAAAARTSVLSALLDDDTITQVVGREVTAMLQRISGMSTGLSPIGHGLESNRSRTPAAPIKLSWQDVHRRDTASLIQRGAWTQGAKNPGASLPRTWAAEGVDLSWVRQNAGLVYLLRSGQWRAIPSTPPEYWAERLVSKVSGLTINEARKILASAFAAAPQLPKAKRFEPLSPDERTWVGQHSTVVRDLSNGKLRGIPSSPTRAWVSAFQSAVDGTMAEVTAILTIILEAIDSEPVAAVQMTQNA